jgi:hypothetical protein
VEAGSYTTEEWPHFDWTELLWMVPMFALMYLGVVFGPGVEELGGGEVALGIALFFLLGLASEAVLYSLVRFYGAAAKLSHFRLGWRSALGSPFVFSDHRFTKGEFATMCILPFLFAVFAAGLCLLLNPLGVGIVAATLLYLASELRRPAALTRVLLHPEGTLFEERKECTLVYLPDRSGSTT